MTSQFIKLWHKKELLVAAKKGFSNFLRHDSNNIDGIPHKVNNLEKRFLVWTGKFKTLADVPAFVSQTMMERARNRMRIRIANYMMLGTVIGCIAMIYSGKQAAKRGESVTQQNLDWHREMNKKAEA